MTPLTKSELRALLKKEANGPLLPGERQKLDNWYNSFDSSQKNLQIFRDEGHEAKVKEKLLERIIASGFPANSQQPHTFKYARLIRRASVAAALLLLIGGALIWRQVIQSREDNATLLSCASGFGKLVKIKLEDGTQIYLNAGSRLRYPKHFAGSHREVYLEGEAYFDVVHDSSKPFIVHTDLLTTNVLGTAFSITAYKDLPVESVTVTRGKVQVVHEKQVLGLLTPNKRVVYNTSNGKSYLTGADANLAVSWTEGRLQFENQNMQDIAGRLGRWYGYSFKFEHSNIKNCQYTASFNNQIPLNNLLKVMKAISLVDYKIDETTKTVTFLGTGCNE